MKRLIGKITSKGYEAMEGQTLMDEYRIDDMLCNRSAPGGLTDNTFTAGQGTLADQFAGEEEMLNVVISNARKRGYEPNRNDIYLPTIGDGIGDPACFVPPGNARGHIKKYYERTGRAGEGVVTVAAAEKPPSEPILLSDKLANEKVAEMRRADSYAAKQDYASLKQAVIEKHKRKPHLPG